MKYKNIYRSLQYIISKNGSFQQINKHSTLESDQKNKKQTKNKIKQHNKTK